MIRNLDYLGHVDQWIEVPRKFKAHINQIKLSRAMGLEHPAWEMDDGDRRCDECGIIWTPGAD